MSRVCAVTASGLPAPVSCERATRLLFHVVVPFSRQVTRRSLGYAYVNYHAVEHGTVHAIKTNFLIVVVDGAGRHGVYRAVCVSRLDTAPPLAAVLSKAGLLACGVLTTGQQRRR